MSVVLRLPFSMETLPLVTLALGLAVSESIQKVTGVAVDLRWPNDVLIGNKKVCGILTQWEPPSIIAGIGINVNNTEFPPELQATSLRIASGRQHAREQIIAELLPAIDTYCGILETEGKEPILRAFTQASTYVTGRKVKIEETALVGTTDGLTNTGFLLIRDDQGKQHQIIAGGVRPC